MIGYHKGGHRFANRDSADADAGVVTAFGGEIYFIDDNVDFEPLANMASVL